ncbi:hypothetical protein FQN54_000205 [Arachnomyces sp. PD_36]|nr:hypothetical protein FQN54_000205 [Arachnomyces sp. PD_36]
MYTHTENSKFLVLLPHTPQAVSMPAVAEKAIVDGAVTPPQSPALQGRSDSFTMASSPNAQNEAPLSLLPGGFLKLGPDTN